MRSSPPFTAEHDMLRRTIRAFVEKEITPHVAAWEDAGRIPRELWRRLGALGLLGLEFPSEYGGGGARLLPGGVVRGGEARRVPRRGPLPGLLATHPSPPPRLRFRPHPPQTEN